MGRGRNGLAWIVTFALVPAAMGAAACGGGDAGAGPATGADGGVPDAPRPTPDSGATDAVFTCGDAPYAEVEVQVQEATTDGNTTPLAAVATVTWSSCPGSLTTDARGKGHARIGANVPAYSTRIEAPGHIPSILPEMVLPAGPRAPSFVVFPIAFKKTIAGWSEDKGLVLGIASPMETSGACAMRDRISFAAKGHPELVTSYYDTATTVAASAKGTTPFGYAAIAGAPPGEKLEIVAQKPECEATTLDAKGIGLVPIERGTISYRNAELRNIAGPKCGPGPYLHVSGVVTERSITDFDSLTPLPGVTIGWDSCPGVTTTPRADGSYAVELTSGTSQMFTFTKSGFIPVAVGQFVANPILTGLSAQMRSDAWRAVEPGWSDTGTSIVVSVQVASTNKSAPCTTPDKITATVKGHPEAVARYVDMASPPAEIPGGVETSKRGVVVLSGLTPGVHQVDVTTTKACKVSTSMAYGIGTVDAHAGVRNVIFAFLEDP